MGGSGDFGTESFGALLRRCRGSRALTQEELAGRAGLHPQEISKLERGVVRSPRSSTVEFLADALKLCARERETFVATARGGLVPAAHGSIGEVGVEDAKSLVTSMPVDALPPHAPLPIGSRMPLAPNPLFVGRCEELLQMAAVLRACDTTVALGQVVASTGLGGLGKTQLAVEFVHRYGRFFAGGVFWLGFASADDIPLQVAECAGPGAMDLTPGIDTLPVAERVQRVRRAWQSAVPRLLVFDNCEEEALLETWRPTSGGCRVLVTSRRSHWSPTLGVTALPLNLLPRPDSVELLRRYRPDVAAGDPRIDGIASTLGDLPLALHLAGRYLHAYGAEISLDDYLVELEEPTLIGHASLLGEGLDASPSPTHHVQSVAQTFALCLGRLDREREVDRVAVALLARMAWMAPGEPVPRELLGRTLEEVEPQRRAAGLRRLGAVGLVGEGVGWLRLHRLLVHFTRQESLDGRAKAAVDLALMACGEAAREGFLMGPALTATIPHIAWAANCELDATRLAALSRSTGLAVQVAGDIRGARHWLERALAVRQRALGADHPDTLTSIVDLGEQLRMQGEFAAARTLHENALAARERVLGHDHEEVAYSANNLAVVLWQQGELDGARRLLERSVAILERTFGPLGNELAPNLNNLARVLVEQGELAAAQPLQERSLYLCERVFGPDHVFASTALNSLARLVQARGDLAGARPLFDRALAIRERAVGPDHPLTAGSLHNLGILRVACGERAAARPFFRRALAIRKRVLGPDHPDTAATRRALAELAAEGTV